MGWVVTLLINIEPNDTCIARDLMVFTMENYLYCI